MEQRALAAFTDTVRNDLFRALDIDPSNTTDLGGFESFVFIREDRNSILRVTHAGHRERNQILGELEWVSYLAANGANVCAPLPIRGDELAVQWGDFVVSEFVRAPGTLVDEAAWGPALFREWGRCIGQFHRLALTFEPSHPVYRRPDCREDDNFSVEGRVSPAEVIVHDRANNTLARFHGLPRSRATFGLIHCDAHPNNFRAAAGNLTFFDFDDACYCWFGYDVATILFTVVSQPWIESTRSAQAAAAKAFLPHFLDGYSQEFEVSDFMLEHLPLFLKVREISLYAVIRAFVDIASEDDSYVNRFMKDRKRLIEQDVPFLDP